MQDQLNRIEGKLDVMHKDLRCYGERIASNEVWIKGHTSTLALIVTSIVAFVVKFFKFV